MMMNLRANYFLLIPSVLAIIVVSFVHPFPYTETKSWIHHQQNFDVVLESENNRNNKASRSSFGGEGECPDCLSQDEASLRLLRPPPTYSQHKKRERELPFLPPPSAATATLDEAAGAEATRKQSQLHYGLDDDDYYEVVDENSAGGAGDVNVNKNKAAQEAPLLAQHSDRNRSSLSKSNSYYIPYYEDSKGSNSHDDYSLSSYYKNIGRRRRIRKRTVENIHIHQKLDLSSSNNIKGIISKSRRRKRSPRARDMSTLTPCLQERQDLLAQTRSSTSSQSSSSSEYIPTCRRDGAYAYVQCHPSTRSCWCVTRNGRPIPGSSILSTDPNKRPSCAKYNRRIKSTTRRRSSQFRKNRKSCNQADWNRFSIALLKTFRSEYNRYRSLTSMTSDMDSASDTTVLSWKFDQVDRNKDMILQRNETNVLKNLVKQQIQPRSCAKNFIASCSNGASHPGPTHDLRNSEITKSEWLDCLRVSSDINLPFDTFNSLVDSSTSRGMHPSLLLKPDDGGETRLSLPFAVSSSSNSASGSASIELTPPFLSLGSVGEPTEQSNCWTDRQSALASQKQNESIIIPECTPTGNYRKVQCAQGKAYCWCVEEESGVQIPNTVVFNTTPDCNNGYSKPMKGCAGMKKHKFLMDFFSTLKSRMIEATRDGGRRTQINISPEEQASRWYFTELDVNGNGLLDRKEWKVLRNETSLDKRLKKCGKKLPRHCDVNQDKKITMTEWLDCLGVKYLGKVPTQTSRKRPVNRTVGRGKNPFTTILKQRRR